MTHEGGRGRLRSGGRLVVDALLAHGARRVFGVPGESFLPILDALFDVRGRLEFVTCRHEHGASMMAEAHGKLTGEPGVCLVTRGPGACNAAIGVHTALRRCCCSSDKWSAAFSAGKHFRRSPSRRCSARSPRSPSRSSEPTGSRNAMAAAMRSARSGRPGLVVLA